MLALVWIVVGVLAYLGFIIVLGKYLHWASGQYPPRKN